ncbi:hypothetical protein [Agarivorans gilvus]|uniref:Uncharacterized protein n=1 Tax=Agarivorans gilvus TaxID=680279 RepID=A0ABQ1I3H8_9ALTE|nr:hypothetical protein [Agarivorans gilvus]GGB12864.1 hypothetical protein GCM10007414_27750 [Agarivorans gilvus]
MEQDQQQTMRCFATGKGFFVRLPVSEDIDAKECESDVEAAE